MTREPTTDENVPLSVIVRRLRDQDSLTWFVDNDARSNDSRCFTAGDIADMLELLATKVAT